MSGSDFTMSFNSFTQNHAAFGATVLERILLAIINAHTSAESHGQQAKRLEAAMTALIGPAKRNDCDMDKALLFIVRQRQRDICDLELDAVCNRANGTIGALSSISKLASLAAQEVLGCSDADEISSTARILCAVYHEWRENHFGNYDHALATLESEAVRRFCDELADWGVTTQI